MENPTLFPVDFDFASEIRNKEIVQIIKLFENIDPKNKKYYSNKTQREACDWLVATYGFAGVVDVILALPQLNTTPYMPTITTPIDLLNKWEKLRVLLIRKQVEVIQNNPFA